MQFLKSKLFPGIVVSVYLHIRMDSGTNNNFPDSAYPTSFLVGSNVRPLGHQTPRWVHGSRRGLLQLFPRSSETAVYVYVGTTS